jgi:excisionase family DNA binding protein
VLTPEQVADLLQVPVTWVYRAARDGRLRKLEGLGRYVRFDGREVEDWIDSQRSDRVSAT